MKSTDLRPEQRRHEHHVQRRSSSWRDPRAAQAHCRDDNSGRAAAARADWHVADGLSQTDSCLVDGFLRTGSRRRNLANTLTTLADGFFQTSCRRRAGSTRELRLVHRRRALRLCQVRHVGGRDGGDESCGGCPVGGPQTIPSPEKRWPLGKHRMSDVFAGLASRLQTALALDGLLRRGPSPCHIV